MPSTPLCGVPPPPDPSFVRTRHRVGTSDNMSTCESRVRLVVAPGRASGGAEWGTWDEEGSDVMVAKAEVGAEAAAEAEAAKRRRVLRAHVFVMVATAGTTLTLKTGAGCVVGMAAALFYAPDVAPPLHALMRRCTDGVGCCRRRSG